MISIPCCSSFKRWSTIFGPAAEKSLSLIYIDETGREKSWDIIAPNAEQFDFWYGALRSILRKIKDSKDKMSLDDLRYEAYWGKADKDRNGVLSINEIVNLVTSINSGLQSKTILKMFRQVDVDKTGTLAFDEFVRFMDLLTVRSANRAFLIVPSGYYYPSFLSVLT